MTTKVISTFSAAKHCKRAALWVFGLLLLTEVVLWAFYRAPVRPVTTLHLHNHFAGLKEKVSISRDNRLLRTIDWTDGDKPAGAVRILCIGGVATEAQFQNASDSWWGQLKVLLEKDNPGIPIQMAAHGANGGLALWGAKWAEAFVPVLKPDIIILNFGGGEILSQPFDYKYDPRRLESMPSMASERTGWRKALFNISQLERWRNVRKRRNETLQLENIVGREDYHSDAIKKMRENYQKFGPARIPFRMSTADPKIEYLDAIKAVHETAKTQGAKLVITGEPCLLNHLLTEELSKLCWMFVPKESGGREAYRPDPEQVEQEMRRFQEAAADYAKQNNLPFVEVNEQIPRDPEHFVSELILTDKGAQIMASVLLPEVDKAVKGK